MPRQRTFSTDSRLSQLPDRHLALAKIDHYEAKGQLFLQQRDPRTAIESLAEASRMCEVLGRADVTLKARHSSILNRLAAAHIDSAEYGSAFANFESAIAISQHLLKVESVPALLTIAEFEYARSLSNFASLHLLMGYESVRQNTIGLATQALRDLFLDAQQRLEDIIAREPGHRRLGQFRQQLAETVSHLAQHNSSLGRVDEALSAAKQATKIRRKMAENNPVVAEYQVRVFGESVGIGPLGSGDGYAVRIASSDASGRGYAESGRRSNPGVAVADGAAAARSGRGSYRHATGLLPCLGRGSGGQADR